MCRGCGLEPALRRAPHRAVTLVVPCSMSPRWAEAVAMCRGCGLEPALRRDPHRAVTLVVPQAGAVAMCRGCGLEPALRRAPHRAATLVVIVRCPLRKIPGRAGATSPIRATYPILGSPRWLNVDAAKFL